MRFRSAFAYLHPVDIHAGAAEQIATARESVLDAYTDNPGPRPSRKIPKKETVSWIEEYYNKTRRYSTLGYLTLYEYELGYRNIHELAA